MTRYHSDAEQKADQLRQAVTRRQEADRQLVKAKRDERQADARAKGRRSP